MPFGPVSTNIGTIIPNGTPGSVLFVGADGSLAQDNVNFFWDGTNKRLTLGTTAEFGFGANGIPDVKLSRITAGTLAQRNGLLPQTLRIYNATDGITFSEFLRLGFDTTNQAQVLSSKAGAGTDRNMVIGALGNAQLRFTTNNVERWAVQNATGDLEPITDNATDIGNTGTQRPKSIFIGTSLQIEANQGLRLTNQINGAGVAAGTLSNAPAAGNPTFWSPILVNGTLRHFPCW